MEVLTSSSYAEYVRWYLNREARKRKKDWIEQDDETLLLQMQEQHGGKVHSWFPSARWCIVQLTSIDELSSLICLDGHWTRRCGLVDRSRNNIRLLSTFVANAKQTNYFHTSPGRPDGTGNIIDDEEYQKRHKYYSSFKAAPPKLLNGNRVVLIEPSDDECHQNPDGTYYLHDGLGRLLTYLYLITYESVEFTTVEAYLALRAT